MLTSAHHRFFLCITFGLDLGNNKLGYFLSFVFLGLFQLWCLCQFRRRLVDLIWLINESVWDWHHFGQSIWPPSTRHEDLPRSPDICPVVSLTWFHVSFVLSNSYAEELVFRIRKKGCLLTIFTGEGLQHRFISGTFKWEECVYGLTCDRCLTFLKLRKIHFCVFFFFFFFGEFEWHTTLSTEIRPTHNLNAKMRKVDK